MRNLILTLLLAATAYSQDVEVVTRPDALYIESSAGSLETLDRAFFHIIVQNVSPNPIILDRLRFELADGQGAMLSGQYSGQALVNLLDGSVDRRRIEPTPRQTLTIGPGQRKAITDILLDAPSGFLGTSLAVEVQYQASGRTGTQKASGTLRTYASAPGRLPFDGVWYVANEHGHMDQHKRYLAEAYAYDFIQIGAGGKSYLRDGSRNADYFAYQKKVLAFKDGVVRFVRNEVPENEPGKPNTATPGGNVVVVEHAQGEFGYYAHLRAGSITLKEGARVRAGDALGEVGNSGDSPEPHLHFHLMNNASVDEADGLPAAFLNWKPKAYAPGAPARQSGILPRGEFVEP